MPSRVDLAKIHIAKKDLGLKEREYRALLRRRYGKGSAAELTARESGDLVRYFRSKGWQPRPGRTPLRAASFGQRRLILNLWKELADQGKLRHPEAESLDHFISHLTGQPGLETLRVRDAIKVIEALKEWRERDVVRGPKSSGNKDRRNPSKV